jgi:hypothetical protein
VRFLPTPPSLARMGIVAGGGLVSSLVHTQGNIVRFGGNATKNSERQHSVTDGLALLFRICKYPEEKSSNYIEVG